MREQFNTVAHHELLSDAVDAVDQLLTGYLGVPVSKAMDIHTPRGFIRSVARLASELRGKSSGTLRQTVKAIVAILDVEWRSLSSAKRNETIVQALASAKQGTLSATEGIRLVLGQAADQVVRATRSDARTRHHLVIAADFNAVDERVIRHVATAHTNFVRDQYGRRNDAFGAQARRIVAHGLEQGLGRDDIAEGLERAATEYLVGGGHGYWDVVAGAFIAEGRSFAQVSAFAEAGIERYMISAVLDEVTTPFCRFIDGKVFTVESALSTLDEQTRVEEPEAIKVIRPWVRERLNDSSGAREIGIRRGDGWTRIAIIERTGVGTRDDRGIYSNGLDSVELASLNLGLPPYHCGCRTTMLPAL